MKKYNLSNSMRILHRYIGFFMAGIMIIYSVSGVILIYRNTDFLKSEKKYDQTFAKNLSEKELGKELKIKNIEITKTEGEVLYFKEGTYNTTTGEAKYTKKELPYLLDKFTKIHKAQSDNTLAPLNVIFGIALFFFVISSFWMFKANSKIFKKGMIYTALGIILSIILIFV